MLVGEPQKALDNLEPEKGVPRKGRSQERRRDHR